MRQWRPSLTGLLAGAAIAAFGRAAVVAVHLDAISTAAMPVLAWAAMIGVATAPSLLEMMVVGALAGFAGGVADRARRTASVSLKAPRRIPS